MNFSVEFQQYHTYIHYHSPIRLNRWLQRITDSHIIVCIVIDIVCPSITHVEIRSGARRLSLDLHHNEE